MNRLYLISVCVSVFLVVVFCLASLMLVDREVPLVSKTHPIPSHPNSEMSITKAVLHDASQGTSDSIESQGMAISAIDEETPINSQEKLTSPLFYHINSSEYSKLSEFQQNSLSIIMQKYIIFHSNYNFSISDIDDWERQVHQINMELVNSLGSDITDKLFRGVVSD